MEKSSFFKRAQKFRSNVANGKYLPILDSLYDIASKYQNNLPHTFTLKGLYGFSTEILNLFCYNFILTETTLAH